MIYLVFVPKSFRKLKKKHNLKFELSIFCYCKRQACLNTKQSLYLPLLWKTVNLLKHYKCHPQITTITCVDVISYSLVCHALNACYHHKFSDNDFKRLLRTDRVSQLWLDQGLKNFNSVALSKSSFITAFVSFQLNPSGVFFVKAVFSLAVAKFG